MEAQLTRSVKYSGITRVRTCFIVKTVAAINPAEIKAEKIKKAMEIIEHVYTSYGIPVEQHLSKSRKNEIITPKRVCVYLMREFLDLTYHAIADLFENDHSTMIYMIRSTNDLMFSDRKFKSKIIELEKELGLRKEVPAH